MHEKKATGEARVRSVDWRPQDLLTSTKHLQWPVGGLVDGKRRKALSLNKGTPKLWFAFVSLLSYPKKAALKQILAQTWIYIPPAKHLMPNTLTHL